MFNLKMYENRMSSFAASLKEEDPFFRHVRPGEKKYEVHVAVVGDVEKQDLVKMFQQFLRSQKKFEWNFSIVER